VRVHHRTPLVLAVIAVALAGYIGLCERQRPSTDQARAQRLQVFPGLARASVSQIEIDRGARGKSTLVRAGEGTGAPRWLVAPDERPAAPGAVADLLDAIDALEIDRQATIDAPAAGLEPAAALLAITLTSAAGGRPARQVLQIGGIDATGRGAFVRRAGEGQILVVGRRLRDLVEQDPIAFRERRVFAPGLVEGTDALAYGDGPGSGRTLRKREGLWLTDAGFFAARAPTGELLRLLTGLEASAFPERRKPPEQPPRWTLALGADDRARLSVWQSACNRRSDPPQWLATASAGAGTSSQIICLAGDTVDRLWRLLAAADRAEPALLPVDPGEVDGVVLADGDRRIHLRRDASAGWRISEPAVDYAADAGRVDEWLASLAALRLSDQTPSPSRSAPPGARRLILEGARRAEIAVAPPRAGRARVERTGELGAATAAAALFADLDPDPLRFRSRQVLELPRFDVTAIDIRAPAGQRRLKRESADQWTGLGSVDSAVVDKLLAPLASLTAERFVADPRPFVARDTLAITSQRGTEVARVQLELDAQCRARLTGTPAFVLKPETCEALRAPMSQLTRAP